MTPYKDIEPLALEKFPEIWEEYLLELDLKGYSTSENWIEELYQMPEDDCRRLGATIVFDNLMVPLIIGCLKDMNLARLHEIFDWLETLASSNDFRVKHGLLKTTICESFLSNYLMYFRQIYPYIESKPNLQSLFRETSKRFDITNDLIELLNKKSKTSNDEWS
jgi:hypothetical protein